MSFIALDICGGRLAKGCGMPGMILHACPVTPVTYLPFYDDATVERWIPS